MTELLNRFIKYVKINTMSKENVDHTPSTKEQFDLANILKNELQELGLEDITLINKCILTATLKSNCSSNLTIGFIAHLDTIPDFSGKNVKPNIIENYDGKDIKLNNITITNEKFPFLKNLKGHTIVTTDGTTVLGADDKAGVAIIMQMLTDFVKNPNLKHVNIKVAFTPDEEIGGGIHEFDVNKFNCDFAYTVDGSNYNEINYENFNAASAAVTIKGLDIHPGDAKGHMLNASLIANEFINMLPVQKNPMYTEGYEGFIHLTKMKGEVGEANLEFILREHDLNKLNELKQNLLDITDFLNKKYKDVVTTIIKDSYYNMYEKIKLDDRSVKRAIKAINDLGYNATTKPIRGGTDGAHLTMMGLNTPNLGTGGYNCHGPYELLSVNEMKKVLEIVKKIAAE